MTLSLSLTGFDPANPVPGIYSELRFAQGETAGDLGPKKVLIIATKTSVGTITAGTQVVGPLSDEADFITYGGVGSPAHRMGAAFLKLCKSVQVYLVCPAVSAGTAAIDEVTFAFTTGSNPTGSGVATVYICNVPCSYAFTASDTATTIADGVKTAINNRIELPVTATAALGVLTITGKIAGTELNSIRFRSEVTAGKNVTTTVTSDTALGASGNGAYAPGTTDCLYTTVLSTILGQKYHYIVPHVQTATALSALLTQVDLQAEPTTGFRQKVIFGSALGHSTAASLAEGTSVDRVRATMVNQQASPEEHYVLAAKAAACIIKEEIADPSYNFDGYGTKSGQTFPVSKPYAASDIPTQTQLATMLKRGVTPIAVADNGTAYMPRVITTRCLVNSLYDYRARDRIVVAVGDKFMDDLIARLAAAPWTKITADPAEGGKQPAAAFATPARVKAKVEQLVSDYVDAGWLDPAMKATILTSIQVGVDPVLSSRMNIVVPIYSAILLHQFGVLGKESSPAN